MLSTAKRKARARGVVRSLVLMAYFGTVWAETRSTSLSWAKAGSIPPPPPPPPARAIIKPPHRALTPQEDVSRDSPNAQLEEEEEEEEEGQGCKTDEEDADQEKIRREERSSSLPPPPPPPPRAASLKQSIQPLLTPVPSVSSDMEATVVPTSTVESMEEQISPTSPLNGSVKEKDELVDTFQTQGEGEQPAPIPAADESKGDLQLEETPQKVEDATSRPPPPPPVRGHHGKEHLPRGSYLESPPEVTHQRLEDPPLQPDPASLQGYQGNPPTPTQFECWTGYPNQSLTSDPRPYQPPNNYVPRHNEWNQQHPDTHPPPHERRQRRPESPLPRSQPYNGRPTQTRRKNSAATTTLKSIWGRVEKGLDGLSQVEDLVVERAQKLATSVSTAVPIKRTFSSSRRSTTGPSEFFPTPTKGRSSQSPPQPTTTPLRPYGQKYEIAKSQRQRDQASKGIVPKQDQSYKADAAAASRRLNWNELTSGKKVMLANGGASTPPNSQDYIESNPNGPTAFVQTSEPQPRVQAKVEGDSQPELQPRPNPSGVPERPLPPQENQNAANSFAGAPYGKQRAPPQRPPSIADPHSRASRIPWDSSLSATTAPSRSAQPPPDRTPLSFEPEQKGLASKILKFVPSMPRIALPTKLFRFHKGDKYQYASVDAWNDQDDDDSKGGFFGLFQRKKKTDSLPKASTPTGGSSEDLAPPLTSLMKRCDNGKTASLLSSTDGARCRGLGRSLAIFDVICLSFILLGVQQINGLQSLSLPSTLAELQSSTLPAIGSLLRDATTTWMPILFGYAYLAVTCKRLLLSGRIQALAHQVGDVVESESLYSQLYLRLAAAIEMDSSIPSSLRETAASQATGLVSTARLNSFVIMILASLFVMTVSLVGPFFQAITQSLTQVLSLSELRSWPIAWKVLFGNMKEILQTLMLSMESLFARGLNNFLDNPVKFAFNIAIFGSIVFMSLIPRLETSRSVSAKNGDLDEDGISLSSTEGAQQVAKLGASSASRLTMLSEDGSIENALERWRTSQAQDEDDDDRSSLLLVRVRRLFYIMLASIAATLPLVVAYAVGMFEKGSAISHSGLKWNSILDVSLVLGAVFVVANNAIRTVTQPTELKFQAKKYLSLLSSTLEEIKGANQNEAGLQFMASVSPTAGLVINDLWIAHTTKRAWAVRGASFQCKNGEVLAILGDDGSGKTRLLTAVAETLLSPAKRAQTSNRVRGYVGISGVESSKWDKVALKRRLGVMLSDISTIADSASLYSGCTIEEILEPVDGVLTANPSHSVSNAAKSSMIQALQITGLYNGLLPRLPSKLNTILTANEEDLRPSALRPRSHVLSPAEWSKLFLTKILAQTIYDNENAASSPDRIDNSMVGSTLLLDDPTVLLSEVEEAKVIRELRQSGAATVMTSNKWATGRFADRVLVIKDGAVLEVGTHNELLARGPQQSLYAAKWHEMTMQ